MTMPEEIETDVVFEEPPETEMEALLSEVRGFSLEFQ